MLTPCHPVVVNAVSLSDLIHQGKLKQGEEVIAVLPGRPRIVVDKGVIGTPQQGILYNHKV